MNQIVPFPVWIGHGGEDHDFPHIFDAGIEAVIELAEEGPSYPTFRDLISFRIPLIDGSDNRPELLALAIRTVATLIEAKIPTLVCCSSGMSRSQAVVAAALAMVSHEPKEACLTRIAHDHPCDVSPGLWHEITKLSPSLFEVGHSVS